MDSLSRSPAPARFCRHSDPAPLRLRGRWLHIARSTWIAIALISTVVFAVGMPLLHARLQTPCPLDECTRDYQLTANGVRALDALGLSRVGYATYVLALASAAALVQLLIATVIIWRQSRSAAALIVAFSLVLNVGLHAVDVVQAAYPAWAVPLMLLAWLGYNLNVLVFYVFPTGHFAPRWTRWLFLAVVALSVPLVAFPDAPGNPFHSFPLLYIGNAALLLPIPIAAQVYRYLRVSTREHRQQTKWLLAGYLATQLGFSGLALLGLLVPEFDAVGRPASSVPVTARAGVYQVARVATGILLSLAVPLAIGFAILRYRLWDIDVLVNRALVYGTLSSLLALIYVGVVVLLQQLTRALAGSGSQLAVVVSTLLIAALFQPLRRRIQAQIDRRFYRRRYDAARTVASFGARLRHEVDLAALRDDLLVTVEDALQPTQVSLWLRSAEHPRTTRN